MSNIIGLGAHTNDSTFVSPEMALNDALGDIGKRGAFEKGKKLLILALDDTDGCYSISFTQAGMKSSEMVALCEIAKTIFLEQLGYLSK